MGKNKQWKTGGKEDKHIEKLIQKGKVTKRTTPLTLKKEHPSIFGDFNTNVVRNHLNLLKRSHGLYLDGEESEDNADDDNINLRQEQPEIVIDVDAPNSSTIANCVTNIHQNYPVLCNVFKDPENQFENVVMAVSLPGGTFEPRVELSADGMVALIKYGWPNSMYNIEDIFKKELETNRISEFHPKILCFKNALEHVRDRVDSRPEGLIKINLPIKVQTAVDTWSKGGIKREDGTYLAYAQFKGFIKEYNKKSNESKLVFNL